MLDAHDEIIGMVSEGDLVVDRFGHDPRSPSADAADLAETMLGSDVRSIPIVEGSTVVGIVSRRDLLRTLVRDDEAIRAEVLERLGTCREPPDHWDVQVTDGSVLLVGDFDDADGRAALALARTVPGVSAAALVR